VSIEALESRKLLSSSVLVEGNLVTIVGTNAADVIEARHSTVFPGTFAFVNVNSKTINLDTNNAGNYRFIVCGKAGDDTITVENAFGTLTDTTVRGGRGNDTISVTGRELVRDLVTGDRGDDSIRLETASSLVPFVGPGPTVRGDGGNDTIDAFSSMDDLIYGGPGNDSITAGPGNDTIDAGEGNDTVFGEDGNDNIYGGSGDDSLDGGAGNDRLFGNAGRDVLVGGPGDDLLVGGPGHDQSFQ
jgi:Ca2+-binding RTX toxin-like protein